MHRWYFPRFRGLGFRGLGFRVSGPGVGFISEPTNPLPEQHLRRHPYTPRPMNPTYARYTLNPREMCVKHKRHRVQEVGFNFDGTCSSPDSYLYTTIMEIAPERPSLLWFGGPNAIIANSSRVYVDPEGYNRSKSSRPCPSPETVAPQPCLRV